MIDTHIICVFWGESFFKTLTEFTLPSLLAPGNLPDWPYRETSELVFYTLASEGQALEQHAIMAELKQWVKTRWVAMAWPTDMDTHQPASKYQIKARFNFVALQQSIEQQCSVVQLIPDMVYATGSLVTLAESIALGKEVVLHIAPRISDTCIPMLKTHKQGTRLDISIPSATELMMQHLHPEYQGCFWLNPNYTVGRPTTVFYWEHHQLVAATYTPEPLFLRHPRLPQQDYGGTLDGGYMQVYEDLITTTQNPPMVVLGGSQLMAFSLAPIENDNPELFQELPLMNRPTLGYLFTLHCIYSQFHDWAFGQRVRWEHVRRPEDDFLMAQYQCLLPKQPWDAPRILRQMVWLLRYGQCAELLDFWQQPAIQAVLLALEDRRLFFWVDVIAQALYKSNRWHELCQFVNDYREQLMLSAYFLPQHCPFYAAYLPVPLSVKIYPQGWPGWESLSSGTFGLIWYDPDAESVLEEQVALQQWPVTVWVMTKWATVPPPSLHPCLYPHQEVPDVLADLIYRCKGLVIPRSQNAFCGESVLLALLYRKPIWWV